MSYNSLQTERKQKQKVGMQWIKKHLPGGGGGGAGAGASTAAPVANSDTWMGSTGHHKGEKGSPELSAVDDNSEDAVRRREIGRSQSFAPPSQSAAEIARSQSMGSPMKGRGSGATPKFQPNMARADEGGDAGPDGEDDGADAAADANAPLEAREECLVTVPDAIVHLVDGEQSPHLATGHLSVVRIVQKGNGIVVLVRVGENLHWPLMQDTPTVKLDPSHYFFSLHIPASVEDANGDGQNEVHLASLAFHSFAVADSTRHCFRLSIMQHTRTFSTSNPESHLFRSSS